MKVVIAIDSMKGSLTSSETNAAMKCGLLERWPEAEIIQVTVSDGGEGFLDAYADAMKLKGCHFERISCKCCDPLMRPISAEYLLLPDGTAVVEVAKVVGMALLKESERNPLTISSYGVGLLLNDILQRGCEHIIIGMGGTVTSDAGIGMTKALTKDIVTVPKVTIATDVDNPLYGPNGAAYVFARQKGACEEDLPLLDRQAREFAEQNAKNMGFDCSECAGAGAAGGLGYAFMQLFGAKRVSGAQLLLDELQFDNLISDADLVITGEGHADRQTLMGKLPQVIMQRCKQHLPLNSRCILIAGRVSNHQELLNAGFSQAIQVTPDDMPLEEAMQKDIAKRNITAAAEYLCF